MLGSKMFVLFVVLVSVWLSVLSILLLCLVTFKRQGDSYLYCKKLFRHLTGVPEDWIEKFVDLLTKN